MITLKPRHDFDVGSIINMNTVEERTWYVYLLEDPREDYPFYIGTTCNPIQRLRSHVSEARNTPADRRSDKQLKIMSIVDVNFSPQLKIVGVYEDEALAIRDELLLISSYTGLTNIKRPHRANNKRVTQ